MGNQCIVLLHEIYGINEHMKSYAAMFEALGFDVKMPNYLSLEQAFSEIQESEAYHHFISYYDWDELTQDMVEFTLHLKRQYSKVIIIGFSIGATVAWRMASNIQVDDTICIYGSRIRDVLDIHPLNDVLLIFGEQEPYVNDDYINMIQQNEHVELKILEGNHGFTNHRSDAFNAVSKNKVDMLLKERVMAEI